MAKKYRLETVLGIRTRARDEAARQVAVRLRLLQASEEELARRQRRLQACCEQQNKAQNSMSEEFSRGIRARDMLAHQHFLNDLRRLESELHSEVEKQLQAVAKAEQELASAREKLSESARELKSIEAHKENWTAAQNREKTRREQKLSDEIGAILHGRRGI